MPFGFGIGLISTDQIADGAITNAKVNAAAAIAASKLDAALPRFATRTDLLGTQTIDTVYQNSNAAPEYHIVFLTFVNNGSLDVLSDSANPPTTNILDVTAEGNVSEGLAIPFLVLPAQYYKLVTISGVLVRSWVKWV